MSVANCGWFALVALGVITFGARTARGADEEPAEVAFEEGLRLFDAGRVDDACPKFEESERLAPAAGTMLNLARCYEGQGKVASAWRGYEEGAALARTTGRASWAALGDKRAALLEPRLARLVLRVPGPDVTVVANGSDVPATAWSEGFPVDPGVVNIEVHAPGKRPWHRDVAVQEAERVAIDTGPLEDDVPPGPSMTASHTPTEAAPIASQAGPVPAPTASQTVPVPSTLVASDVPRPRSDLQRYLGATLAGVGTVGLALGTGFGLDALVKKNDAADLCPDKSHCTDPAGAHSADEARSSATASTIAFVAGGALLAGGAVLFFTARTNPTRTGAERSWQLGVGLGSLTCGRSF